MINKIFAGVIILFEILNFANQIKESKKIELELSEIKRIETEIRDLIKK